MKNKNKIVMLVSLFLVFVFMLIGSFFNSGNGSVTVRNIYYPDSEGNILRAQLFTPDGASSSDPAPAILNMHGGGDHLECVGNFSLELARRGYVVLNVDAYGSGYSDPLSSNIVSGAGAGNNDSSALKNDGGATVSLKQLLSYEFVDQDNIGLIGHSMGGTFIANAALEYADHVKAILPWGSGSFLDLIKLHESSDWTFNIGYIDAQNDEMVIFATHLDNTTQLLSQDFIKDFFGVDEDIVPSEIYGSFDNGDARVIYTPTASHVGNIISSETIGDLLGFFESAMPTDTALQSTDQIWQYKEAFGALAIVSLLCFVISLGFVLLKGKAFSSLVNEGLKPSVQMGGLVKWIGIIILVAIPMLTLYNIGLPLTTIKANSLFPMNWGNYYAWLAAINAGIILVLFIIWHFVYGKKHGGSLQSYGFQSQGGVGKTLMQIVKALGFAVAVVFVIYLVVNICYGMFNIDFRFWIFGIKPMSANRLPYIFGYLLMFLFAFGVLNTVSISFASLSADDKSKWGVFKQYATSWLVGAGGFTIVLLIYYFGLRANHYPPFFVGYGPFPGGHPNALVYSIKLIAVVPQFTIASIVNTALYRKTKNIYVGWFVSALLLAAIAITFNAFS